MLEGQLCRQQAKEIMHLRGTDTIHNVLLEEKDYMGNDWVWSYMNFTNSFIALVIMETGVNGSGSSYVLDLPCYKHGDF